MLTIDDRLAAVGLAALQQQRVPPVRDRRGVEAQHRSRLKAAAEQVSARMSIAQFSDPNWSSPRGPPCVSYCRKPKAVQHEQPRSDHLVAHRQRHGVGDPCCAGPHALHRNAEAGRSSSSPSASLEPVGRMRGVLSVQH